MDNSRNQRITRVGARRRGDDYQDLVALDVLVDWLGHSDSYNWVKVEADEFGSLDDVVVLRSDNHLAVKQVKYSNHPDADDDPLTWDDLLYRETDRSTSLLEKWSRSLEELQQTWSLEDASVVSNRRASSDLSRAFRESTDLIDFDSIQPDEIKEKVIAQIGDTLRARTFFQLFHFRLNRPNFEELEEALKRKFIDQLKGTELGWKNLKEQLRGWVAFKDRPRVDGFIDLEDVRTAALWNTLNELPQEFELPDDYVLPSEDFHQEILDKIVNKNTGCLVITGNPGVGKSSYCSLLYKRLREKDLPVIRHHYYVSTSDRYRSPRLNFERAAASLLHDLIRDYRDSLGQKADTNPFPENLGEFLEVSGGYFTAHSQQLIVIVDV